MVQDIERVGRGGRREGAFGSGRCLRLLRGFLAVALFAGGTSLGAEEAPAWLTEVLVQDADLPARWTVLQESVSEGERRATVTFAGADLREVPGVLGRLEGEEEPRKLALLLHGFGGRQEMWWGPGAHEAVTRPLLERGFEVATLDLAFHGQRSHELGYREPGDIQRHGWAGVRRDLILRTVRDARRLIDVLEAERGSPYGEVVVTGYSLGGIVAHLLATVDERVTTLISMATPLDRGSSVFRPAAVAQWIRAPRVLYVTGRSDGVAEGSDVRDIRKALPKEVSSEVIWYDGGHQVTPEAFARALRWLDEGGR